MRHTAVLQAAVCAASVTALSPVRAVLVEVAAQALGRGGERGLQAARAGPDRRGTRG